MKGKKILVLGHKGLVGSAICRQIYDRYGIKPITVDRQEVDLSQSDQVSVYFEKIKPEWVFLAAARVGGIGANSSYPVEFLLDNLKIQNNVIENCYKNRVEKFLFLGSSCIYPKNAPQPIQEESLLTSPLEATNEAYALAKITGLKLCRYYNQQYGTNYLTAMPCNVYGLNDNYHPFNSHVFPALIRKIHEAKEKGDKNITLWGSGTPLREFIFADDLAEGLLFLMEKADAHNVGELINIGTGDEITIESLARLMMEVIGYKGEIIFDPSHPDGTMRKVMDNRKIKKLGWKSNTSLREGILKTYQDFSRKYS